MRKNITSQTPNSKSKFQYDLSNFNLAKKKGKFKASLKGHMRKKSGLKTPKQAAGSSSRKIQDIYEKPKRSIRQIYSDAREYESFNENPQNLVEVRRKLNLTGGYSESLGSSNLKTYGTNKSNQSQQNSKKGQFRDDPHLKPTPGAFLKNSTREDRQIMIEDRFLSYRKGESGLRPGKLRARKDKLRKHLFNQNNGRIKSQKISGLKGIYSKISGKYTSSRDVNQKNYNFENFQSYRGFPKQEIDRQIREGFGSQKGREDLDSREAIERFADYIAEGKPSEFKEYLTKHQVFSAQVSPKLKRSQFTSNNQ